MANLTFIGRTAQIVDSRDHGVLVAPIGDLQVQTPIRLCGPTFDGGTLDTNFWVSTVSGAGAANSIGSSIATMDCGTASNGSAVLRSARKARFMFAHPNKFRACIHTPDAGTADNVRSIGADDGTDGFGFILNGTSFGVYTRVAGVQTIVTTGFSGQLGSTYAWTAASFRVLEIVYFTAGVWFYVDGVLLHKIIPTTDPYASTLTLPIRAASINSGNTASKTLHVWNASIIRLGNSVQRPRSGRISSNTTTVLKRGPGTLHRVIVGIRGVGGNTITIYDDVSASGTPVALLDGTVNAAHWEFNLDFFTGLTVVTSAGTAGDFVFIYD